MTLNVDRSQWQTVKFGDVVKSVNESVKDPAALGIERVIGLEHLEPGKLRIERWGEVTPETKFTRSAKPGQTLFGKRRSYQRKTAYAEFDAVCSGDILVFESANSTQLLPELLPFIAMTDAFYNKALETSAGSLSPRTRWSDLAKYEFDLPPIDQQRRIADLLWKLEEHREALAVTAAFTHDAQMAAAAHWMSSRPGLSVRLGEVCVVRSGATPSRSQQERYFENGTTPWVKTLDLNEGSLLVTDECITERALEESSCRIFPAGTVLVAMYGGFGQIGRTSILRADAATNQAISALTSIASDIRPEFIQLVLQVKRERWRRVAASSRKDPNITKTDVENFEIPRLTLADQDALLSLVDNIGNAKDAIAQEQATFTLFRESASDTLWGRL